MKLIHCYQSDRPHRRQVRDSVLCPYHPHAARAVVAATAAVAVVLLLLLLLLLLVLVLVLLSLSSMRISRCQIP